MGVQYLGEGLTDVGVNDVGVKGVRNAKESVSCEVGCEQRASCRLVVVPAGAGMVASMGVCLQGMSSCDESLSGSGRVPVKGVSPVVPVVEASFNLCPVLPVNGLLEDKTKSPCGRGSIVVYKNRL